MAESGIRNLAFLSIIIVGHEFESGIIVFVVEN